LNDKCYDYESCSHDIILACHEFHALCDGIRGLLFLMLFEKPRMLLCEYDGGFSYCMVVHGSIPSFGGSTGFKS